MNKRVLETAEEPKMARELNKRVPEAAKEPQIARQLSKTMPEEKDVELEKQGTRSEIVLVSESDLEAETKEKRGISRA